MGFVEWLQSLTAGRIWTLQTKFNEFVSDYVREHGDLPRSELAEDPGTVLPFYEWAWDHPYKKWCRKHDVEPGEYEEPQSDPSDPGDWDIPVR